MESQLCAQWLAELLTLAVAVAAPPLPLTMPLDLVTLAAPIRRRSLVRTRTRAFLVQRIVLGHVFTLFVGSQWQDVLLEVM